MSEQNQEVNKDAIQIEKFDTVAVEGTLYGWSSFKNFSVN